MKVLDDTKLTAETERSINFSEEHKQLCLSLLDNGVNSYIFVNGVKISKLCLGNVSKDFSVDNVKKLIIRVCP